MKWRHCSNAWIFYIKNYFHLFGEFFSRTINYKKLKEGYIITWSCQSGSQVTCGFIVFHIITKAERHTSKWLFAWTDHSSLVENIRPHNSHDHDSCWCVWGIVNPAKEELLWWWLWEWTMLWATVEGVCCIIVFDWCSKFCLLFSLFSSFFFISKRSVCVYNYKFVYLKKKKKYQPACRLFNLLPNGAILVGVTCLNLFIWITNLSLRAKALLHT